MDIPSQVEMITFFQLICESAEAAYAKDPLDADNLTRWGSALLELSNIELPNTAKKMLKDAKLKFEEALEINSEKPATMWLLGNTLIALAFLIPDAEEAGEYISKATVHFAAACEMEPRNQKYAKSLENVGKAPEIHAELRKQLVAQQVSAAPTGPSSSSSDRTAKKKGKNSDLKYDIMGWVILGIAIVAWVRFSRNNMPPPPPPR